MAKTKTKSKKSSTPASAPAEPRDLLTRVERDFLAKMGAGNGDAEADAAGQVLIDAMAELRAAGSDEKKAVAAGKAAFAKLNSELAKISDGAKRSHLKSCVHSAVRFGVQKAAGVPAVKKLIGSSK